MSVELFLVVSLIIIIALLFVLKGKASESKKLKDRYSGIVDVDKAVSDRRATVSELENSIDEARNEYAEKRQLLGKLDAEVNLLEEHLEDMSFGFYEPHFDYDDPEKYKAKIKENREQQKLSVRQKKAAECTTSWQVEGSAAKGRTMINRQIKLMLRAFNGECDAALSKVKWNNIEKMEQRIQKAADAINKLGESSAIYIAQEYIDLKLKELWLTHEEAERKQEIKDEQRELREQMREEARVEKEIEVAKKKAIENERRSEQALEAARRQLEGAHGDALIKLQAEIDLLQANLAAAHEMKERAMSRAQMTKAGHVYVISNMGSFGEDVYKIGMTRRLEPLDRVKELGDASVPFTFDVHAMVFSENAPALEAALHREFDTKRLNRVNNRKEFFRVELQEIEQAVKANDAEIEITKFAEAQEYRETLALIKKAAEQADATAVTELPDAI